MKKIKIILIILIIILIILGILFYLKRDYLMEKLNKGKKESSETPPPVIITPTEEPSETPPPVIITPQTPEDKNL